jgi:hypothetical protein
MVGAATGDRAGNAVGEGVGEVAGTGVGTGFGYPMRVAVGTGVGKVVGQVVGGSVGWLVGAGVSKRVRASVGPGVPQVLEPAKQAPLEKPVHFIGIIIIVVNGGTVDMSVVIRSTITVITNFINVAAMIAIDGVVVTKAGRAAGLV